MKVGDIVIGRTKSVGVEMPAVIRRMIDKNTAYLEHLGGGGIGMRDVKTLRKYKNRRLWLFWACYKPLHNHWFKRTAWLCMKFTGPPKGAGLNETTPKKGIT